MDFQSIKVLWRTQKNRYPHLTKKHAFVRIDLISIFAGHPVQLSGAIKLEF